MRLHGILLFIPVVVVTGSNQKRDKTTEVATDVVKSCLKPV